MLQEANAGRAESKFESRPVYGDSEGNLKLMPRDPTEQERYFKEVQVKFMSRLSALIIGPGLGDYQKVHDAFGQRSLHQGCQGWQPSGLWLRRLPASSAVQRPPCSETLLALLAALVLLPPHHTSHPQLKQTIVDSLAHATEHGIPVVIDGSGLNFIAQQPELVRGHSNVLLTPNMAEFGRLAEAVGLKLPGEIGTHWQQHVSCAGWFLSSREEHERAVCSHACLCCADLRASRPLCCSHKLS